MSTGKVRPKPWESRARGPPPRARRQFDPSDRCYECGERGHYAYDCRNRGSGGGRHYRSRSRCVGVVLTHSCENKHVSGWKFASTHRVRKSPMLCAVVVARGDDVAILLLIGVHCIAETHLQRTTHNEISALSPRAHAACDHLRPLITNASTAPSKSRLVAAIRLSPLTANHHISRPFQLRPSSHHINNNTRSTWQPRDRPTL